MYGVVFLYSFIKKKHYHINGLMVIVLSNNQAQIRKDLTTEDYHSFLFGCTSVPIPHFAHEH